MIRPWLHLNLAVLTVGFSVAASAQPVSQSDQPQRAPPGFWDQATLTGDWGGLRTRLEDAGVKLGLQEQSEVWANLTGGQHRGIVYDGLTTASVTLDLDKLVGWTGATFFTNVFQIHGRGPSGHLIGNMQVVSNIEATPGTKLYDLWLEQSLLDGRLNIRFGQEGANDEMMVTQYGALFLNASFGYPAIPAVDIPSGGPNYPLAAPFIRVRYQPTRTLSLVGAIYTGDPAPPGPGDPQQRDRHGTAFRLNDHVLAFAELWYTTPKQNAALLPATYKLGAWTDTAQAASPLLDTSGLSLANPASNGVARPLGWDYAAYGVIDQMVWRDRNAPDQNIGVFLEVMGAPANRNFSNLFIEGGLNWTGPIPGHASDVLGLAVSYEGLSPAARRFGADEAAYHGGGAGYASNETVIEVTYVYHPAGWLTFQPDVQYVVNPGTGITGPTGMNRTLNNAVAAGVRAQITF